MGNKFYDLTFTPSVRQAQEDYGSRRNYARMENETEFGGLSETESDFIARSDGFYLATVGEEGQPYIQYRGGARGFLKVLDERTLGFADFRGNLQYISVGNLRANDKAALFLMDYANRRRLKILARTEVKEAKQAPELIEKLAVADCRARIERAMIFHLKAFDWNCPQHITERYTLEEVGLMNQPLYEHLEKLEAENRRLRDLLGK